ncbi:MAG TPA: hypothetical protein VGM10_35120 [Actinocrinis sp.]
MDGWTAAHRALAEDLAGQVAVRLLDPLEILVGADDAMRARVAQQSRTWAAALLGEDEMQAALTAGRLVAALCGHGDEPFDPPAVWWGTPFGRVVALRIGHPSAQAVSVAQAAAMLGISRQGVHDLANRGRLERDAEGRIAVSSVRARLAARARAVG